MNDPNQSLPRISYEEMMACSVATSLDASGLRCPLPLLRAKQALRDLVTGELLRVIATDAGSIRDFYAFAEISGHRLEGFCERDGSYLYILRKK